MTVRVEPSRKKHMGSMCPSQRGCLYLKECRSFLATLNLNTAYMDPEHDRCYCSDCATRIPEVLEVSRPHCHAYEVPKGWCGFGLKADARASALKAFEEWVVRSGYPSTGVRATGCPVF